MTSKTFQVLIIIKAILHSQNGFFIFGNITIQLSDLKQYILVLAIYVFSIGITKAQPVFSIATDATILRSLSPQQHFFAVGQTVTGNIHFTKKETLYAWVAYYTNGKFKNSATAIANSITTNPQTIHYTVYSKLRYRQISVGWKHYFRGSYNEEMNWNLYGLAGFGLLLGSAENTYNTFIDTLQYTTLLHPLPGAGSFKRLTFDIGVGNEIPLSTSIYLYTELRSWLPASDYPSPYLINNSKVPLSLILCGGLRVLIY